MIKLPAAQHKDIMSVPAHKYSVEQDTQELIEIGDLLGLDYHVPDHPTDSFYYNIASRAQEQLRMYQEEFSS